MPFRELVPAWIEILRVHVWSKMERSLRKGRGVGFKGPITEHWRSPFRIIRPTP